MVIPLSGKKGKYAQRNEQWRDASQHIAGTGLLKIGFASASVERLGLPRPMTYGAQVFSFERKGLLRPTTYGVQVFFFERKGLLRPTTYGAQVLFFER